MQHRDRLPYHIFVSHSEIPRSYYTPESSYGGLIADPARDGAVWALNVHKAVSRAELSSPSERERNRTRIPNHVDSGCYCPSNPRHSDHKRRNGRFHNRSRAADPLNGPIHAVKSRTQLSIDCALPGFIAPENYANRCAR